MRYRHVVHCSHPQVQEVVCFGAFLVPHLIIKFNYLFLGLKLCVGRPSVFGGEVVQAPFRPSVGPAGIYAFDVMLPNDYPAGPPKVKFHAYGMRINPNLYEDGFVCLSLLGLWAGPAPFPSLAHPLGVWLKCRQKPANMTFKKTTDILFILKSFLSNLFFLCFDSPLS